jgi:beta-lactam-binding protein with PASTA domain
VRICQSCGRENAEDSDFCACGEYLRWEPTSFVSAVKPPGGAAAGPGSEAGGKGEVGDPNLTLAPSAAAGSRAAPTPATGAAPNQMPGAGAFASPPAGADVAPARAEAPPGVASLLLRRPEDEGPVEGPVEVRVDPGGRVTILGLIRNQGAIVDNYDIAVAGMPDGWWTVTPPTAYLVPYGAGGIYEQEVQIILHPPRAPEALAGAWPLEVTATSRAYGSEVARAPATVTIGPYQDVASELRPERASGRLKARFVLTVHNRANAPTDVAVAAEDADDECHFRFAEPTIAVEPGQAIEAPFTVFPPRQHWIGRPHDRRLGVTATPVGSDQPSPPRAAVYRQRAWLPWWLSIVAPLVALALVALLLLLPKKTTVPNLEKASSVFAAQKLLGEAGLKLSPQVGEVTKPEVRPGTIVEQSPAAGKHVKKGSLVTIEVAKGTGKDKVPSVIGLTPVTAAGALRTAGVALGAISPQPVNPTGKIASQIPAANETVPAGTPVAVFLAPPGKAGGAAKAAGAAAAGAAAGAAGAAAAGKGGEVTIPKLGGAPTAAAAALSQLGLVPSTSERFAPAAKGALIGSSPSAGTKVKAGTKVAVLVSAGFPDLSYDNGTAVQVVDGASGKPVMKLAPSTQSQEEASWSIDGSHLVYRQGNGLELLAAGKSGAQPVGLTGTEADAHDPAFAPTTKANILAYVEDHGGSSQLCFATIGPYVLAPDCTSHPGWELGRQISWAPDGSSLLVFGVQTGHPGTFGLIEFVSNVPFSTQASNWGHGTLVTSDAHTNEGVIAGVFSPNGKQLALIANFGGGGFHLYLAPADEFTLARAKALPVAACQVSWRSDGEELAVMQADSPCQDPTGNIVTISPSNPSVETVIATDASHPAWQPVTLHG